MAQPETPTTEQQQMLESCARARTAAVRGVERALLIMVAAAGAQEKQIAAGF